MRLGRRHGMIYWVDPNSGHYVTASDELVLTASGSTYSEMLAYVFITLGAMFSSALDMGNVDDVVQRLGWLPHEPGVTPTYAFGFYRAYADQLPDGSYAARIPELGWTGTTTHATAEEALSKSVPAAEAYLKELGS